MELTAVIIKIIAVTDIMGTKSKTWLKLDLQCFSQIQLLIFNK